MMTYQLTDADMIAIKRTLRPATELLQLMRQARYLATIDAGRNKGRVNLESLRRERGRLGITPTMVCEARRKQAVIAKQAAAKGLDPKYVVAVGRKANTQDVRDRWASIIPMLSRGAGYYPSPVERISQRNAH